MSLAASGTVFIVLMLPLPIVFVIQHDIHEYAAARKIVISVSTLPAPHVKCHV